MSSHRKDVSCLVDHDGGPCHCFRKLPDSSQGKEELRPCPFCGDEAFSNTPYVECESRCTPFTGKTTEDWNQAYCWKELSERERQVVEAKKEAEELKMLARLATDSEIRLTDELREWKQWAERLAVALGAIASSSPCKEGHESFNSPGQPCDQRIAHSARSDFQKFKESQSSSCETGSLSGENK